MNPDSPYKGLVPFEDNELDAFLFFGRERESKIIAANLLAARLTVLYGPSGVGKSSVLRAGAAHQLRRQARVNIEERGQPEFAIVVFDGWSEDPVVSLRTAVREELADQSGSALLDEVEGESLSDTLGRWTEALACDLLLVLDQAEEYFLYDAEETGFARELPELVTRPGLRVRVLLALRDDALAKLDRFKGQIPNLFANYLRLDHLDRSSARDAITRPVERYNEATGESIVVEPALIESVLDQTAAGKVDLGDAGRGLAAGETDEGRIEAPYLQLVLERIWEEERAEGSSRLRAKTLARLGGAESIVRTHLHRAVEELSADEKDVAADVFRYLVTPSGTKIAHGVGDLAEYASVDEQRLLPVLSTLGRERIVRPVDGAEGGGSRYEIFHDVLGEAVLAWRRERELERERRAATSRQRRLFTIAVGALIALAAMTAVAIYAFSQRANARQASERAQARALLAEALHQLDVDPQLSLLLGLRAAAIERTGQTQDVLSQALEASRMRDVQKVSDIARLAPTPGEVSRLGQTLNLPRSGVAAVAFSPDGRLVATGHRDHMARLWSARTGRLLKVLTGHFGQVIAVAFSPDGKLLATGASDGSGRLWSAKDGLFLGPLVGHTGSVTTVAFNPRSDLVATGSLDRTVRVWQTALARLPLVLRGHRESVTRLMFTPDGRRIVTVSADGTRRLWDPEPEPQMSVVPSAEPPRRPPLVAEAQGKRATVDGERVLVRDVRTGKVIPLVGHSAPVTSVHFDGSGKRLVTSSEDRDARIWDARTGANLHVLRGHFNVVNDAEFSPDGRWVVTAGPISAGLWRSDSDSIHTYMRNTERPIVARFDGDRRIVTLARDGKVREWLCDFCGTLDQLVRLANARLAHTGRTFTPVERERYLNP
ncbi:MAG: AAA family ATPase [Actinomycetota bacterium]